MDEQFANKIQDHHSDELKDKETYEALAAEAEMHGLCKTAGILRDIAHDESTHATALQHILELEENNVNS